MRRLHREQRGRVVGQAAQLRGPSDGPARTRPPGADDELATGIDHLDARRAVGRACGAPRAARLEPDRRVAVAVSEWRERPHELVALRAFEPDLQIGPGGGHDGHRSPGSQPSGASSKPSNRKAGETVQPTKVQSPRLRADCQASAGTDDLRAVAAQDVVAEPVSHGRSAVSGDRQLERRSRVVVPDLGGVDPMPARAIAAGEQEEDGAAGPARRSAGIVAPRLGVEPALGMRLEPELADEPVGRGRGHGGHRQRG